MHVLRGGPYIIGAMPPNLRMMCDLLVPLLAVMCPLVAASGGGEIGGGRLASEAGRRVRRATTDLTAAQHQAYVTRHNELRGQVSPEAANMEHMVYDASLAGTAQQWSQKCDFRHSSSHSSLTLTLTQQYGDDYGENLAVTTQGDQPDVNAVLQAWFDEEQHFGFDDLSCVDDEQCGHYTQVVWAQSNVVGCGIHHCPDGVTISDAPNPTYIFSGLPAWMITCHYAPGGNYVGVKPFISGSSCTKCDSGLGLCLNNNCASESVCSDESECDCRARCLNCATFNEAQCQCECTVGWSGADCSIECRDEDSVDCVTVAAFPDLNCPAFNDECPVACSVCSPPAEQDCGTPAESTTASGSDDGAQTEEPEQTAPSSTAQPCTTQCEDGSTLNPADCSCACASGYQGTTCQLVTSQVPFTVEFRIIHTFARFGTVRSPLLRAVARALNAFCASSDNDGMCCPDVTNPATNRIGFPDFIDESHVLVASGYPTPETSSIYRVGVVALDVQSPLCGALGSGQRKRRSAHQEGSDQRRFRRQTDINLPQELLNNAIAADLTDIRQELLALDNADILSPGPVDADTTTSPVTTTAAPTSPTAVIVAVAVAGVALLLLLLCLGGLACLAGSRGMAGPKYDDPPGYRYGEEREPARRRPAARVPDYIDSDPVYHPAGYPYDYVSPARAAAVTDDREYAYTYAYPGPYEPAGIGRPNLYALDELSPRGRDYFLY